jgi:hypothetical protein
VVHHDNDTVLPVLYVIIPTQEKAAFGVLGTPPDLIRFQQGTSDKARVVRQHRLVLRTNVRFTLIC